MNEWWSYRDFATKEIQLTIICDVPFPEITTNIEMIW